MRKILVGVFLFLEAALAFTPTISVILFYLAPIWFRSFSMNIVEGNYLIVIVIAGLIFRITGIAGALILLFLSLGSKFKSSRVYHASQALCLAGVCTRFFSLVLDWKYFSSTSFLIEVVPMFAALHFMWLAKRSRSIANNQINRMQQAAPVI